MLVRLKAIGGALLCLTACVPFATSLQFRTAGLTGEQWNRIADECSYEADKATASASNKTAFEYRNRRLYIMCAELKGAKYVGYVRLPADEWIRIRKLCIEEASAAIAGIPASRSRDESWDDRKLECIKRNGVTIRDDIPA